MRIWIAVICCSMLIPVIVRAQVCSRPSNWGLLLACRQADVTVTSASAVSPSEIAVHQRNEEDEGAFGNPGAQANLCQIDNTYELDFLICVNTQRTSAINVTIRMPTGGAISIRRIEVQGSMPNAPLNIEVTGRSGNGIAPFPPTVLQRLVIAPTAAVHVQFDGVLSNLGYMEAGAITSLIFADDRDPGAAVNCSDTYRRNFGMTIDSQASRILIRNRLPVTPPTFFTGVVSARSRTIGPNFCNRFNTSVLVENGSVISWFFEPEWTIASPEFKATSTSAGNLVNVRAGKIGPTLLNTRVAMQAKRIDTLQTLSEGITADIVAQSIDDAGGTSVGINAKKGLIGSIFAENIATGVTFIDPGTSVLGLASGSTIRVRSLDSGSAINLPTKGLKGQIIINALNTDPGAWLGTVSVGGVPLNHTAGEYPQTEAQLGGGAVGLVPFKVRVQDTNPPVFSGFRRLHAASFSNGQIALRPSFYGPILPSSVSTSNAVLELLNETTSQWTAVPSANYAVTPPPPTHSDVT